MHLLHVDVERHIVAHLTTALEDLSLNPIQNGIFWEAVISLLSDNECKPYSCNVMQLVIFRVC